MMPVSWDRNRLTHPSDFLRFGISGKCLQNLFQLANPNSE